MKKRLTALWGSLNLNKSRKIVFPVTGELMTNNTGNNSSGEVQHQFDMQGRLAKSTRSDGSKTIYEYSPGNVTLKMHDGLGKFLYSYNYELNDEGQFSRVTKSDNPWYEEVRQYNTDKSIAKTITNLKGLTRVLAYGNNVRVRESYVF